jgi:hypothetical protein
VTKLLVALFVVSLALYTIITVMVYKTKVPPAPDILRGGAKNNIIVDTVRSPGTGQCYDIAYFAPPFSSSTIVLGPAVPCPPKMGK